MLGIEILTIDHFQWFLGFFGTPCIRYGYPGLGLGAFGSVAKSKDILLFVCVEQYGIPKNLSDANPGD